MKRTFLKRKSNTPQRKLKDEIWFECRRIAQTLYKPQDGIYRCYTCNNPIEGKGKQLGHFIAKSICGTFLKFDMRNLRWQCYRCNINLSGNGAVFYNKLREELGQEYIDELFRDKQKIVKESEFLPQLLAKYKNL